MRYGRTSMVNFLSQLAMSFSGFVATIVLTRTLGQSQYGTYAVILSVLSWVAIAGKLGLSDAIRKRVSESNEGNYVVTGTIVQAILYIIVAVCLWVSRSFINDFIGVTVTWALIVMLAARLGFDFVQHVLDGQHLVHVSSILSPVEWTFRSVVQVGLVLSGAGLIGALTGYIVGAAVAAIIGLYFVSIPSSRPTFQEFVRLREYAQFSWLSSFKGRTFMSMDTIILAIFVSHSLVAIYEIAWNLAGLFATFGGSITRTLFPEMSSIASDDGSDEEISRLLRLSLAYSGLFIIPGLVGAGIVGDVVLTIYGEGFETGYYILLVLISSQLLYGYKRQFLSTINALNRPDLTFYINSIFVGVNMSLNILLTWQYGWYGAAVATAISAALGLVLGYHYTRQIIRVAIPASEIAKQCLSAGIMAVVVFSGRELVGEELPVIIVLIAAGAFVYFAALLFLSQEFRTTVEDNLPFDLPIYVR